MLVHWRTPLRFHGESVRPLKGQTSMVSWNTVSVGGIGRQLDDGSSLKTWFSLTGRKFVLSYFMPSNGSAFLVKDVHRSAIRLSWVPPAAAVAFCL